MGILAQTKASPKWNGRKLGRLGFDRAALILSLSEQYMEPSRAPCFPNRRAGPDADRAGHKTGNAAEPVRVGADPEIV